MKRKLVITFLMVISILLCGCGKEKSLAEDFSFEMVDGEIIITGYLGIDRDIVIPDEINNRPVTVIAEEAFHEYDMLSVAFPKHLRVIEANAFAGCNCLTAVTFPASLEEIGEGAFWSCDQLSEVKLPDGLKYLGSGAFGACESLTSLELPVNFEGFSINGDFGSPVSDNTVLLVKKGSMAHKLIELHGNGKVNYKIIGDEKAADKDIVVYLVEEKCTYNSENVMIQKTRYTYDENGNMLTEEVDDGKVEEIWNEELLVYEYVVGKVDRKIDYTYEWTYDDYGNSTAKTRMNQDGSSYSYYNYEYSYVNGLPVKQDCLCCDDDYRVYEYDEHGRLVLEYMYRLEYKQPVEYEYTYSDEGLLLGVVRRYGLDDIVETRFVYENPGRIVRIETAGYEHLFEYDEEGRIASEEIHHDGQMCERHDYSYDRNNLVEEERVTIIQNGNERVKTIKYSYVKAKLTDSEAYHSRIQWQWYMNRVESYY